MNSTDYRQECLRLLDDSTYYVPINMDPTKKLQVEIRGMIEEALARMRPGVFRLPGYTVYYRRIRDSLYFPGNTDPGRYTGYGSSNTK
ncbi:hypothetical protein NDU88_009283 [Pleurodeles waltl]|uniref:Uncharacterized protein n=1 Tax=Pleurodeles waltl TaxID=8319 RepID=A0AAV7RYL3_PLEWA|nr:hypothetical protein NDU88_009283 [Pleurodeles waltl]